jgi:hypothetical protein
MNETWNMHGEVMNDKIYERNKPLQKYRRRWEDNIKMNLKEIGCHGVKWIQYTEDTIQCRNDVNTLMLC